MYRRTRRRRFPGRRVGPQVPAAQASFRAGDARAAPLSRVLASLPGLRRLEDPPWPPIDLCCAGSSAATAKGGSGPPGGAGSGRHASHRRRRPAVVQARAKSGGSAAAMPRRGGCDGRIGPAARTSARRRHRDPVACPRDRHCAAGAAARRPLGRPRAGAPGSSQLAGAASSAGVPPTAVCATAGRDAARYGAAIGENPS